MSDRLEAAEALLATIEAGRGRMEALAHAYLPFKRVVAITVANRVGGSPERLSAELQAEALDRQLGEWRRAYAHALTTAGRALADEGLVVAIPRALRPEVVPALAPEEERPTTDLGAGAEEALSTVEEPSVKQSGVRFPALEEPTAIGEIPPEIAAEIAARATLPDPDEGLDEATALASANDIAQALGQALAPADPAAAELDSSQLPYHDAELEEEDSLFTFDAGTEDEPTSVSREDEALPNPDEDDSAEPADLLGQATADEDESWGTPSAGEDPSLPVLDGDFDPFSSDSAPFVEEPTDPGLASELDSLEMAPLDSEEVEVPALDDLDLQPLEEASLPLLGSAALEPFLDEADLSADDVLEAESESEALSEDPSNEATTIASSGSIAEALAAAGLSTKAAAGQTASKGALGLSSPRSVAPMIPEIKEGPAAPTLAAPRPMAASIQLMGDGKARTITDTLELGSAEDTASMESVEEEDSGPVGGGGFALNFEAAEEEDPSEVHIPELSDDPSQIRIESVLDHEVDDQRPDDTKVADGYTLAAQAAEGRGDLQAAVTSYGDVLSLDPDRVAAYLARGRCLLELGDYAAAMSDFQKAEDLSPDSPEALVEMGNLFFARKEYRRAIHYYDQAIELDPTHAMARCRRGICHHYRKDYDQALADLQRAYSLDPEIPNIGKYVQMAVKAMRRPTR